MSVNVIKMTDEDVVYHTEVFLIFYLSDINFISEGVSNKLVSGIFNANFRDVLRDNLKSFLREPLKDPRFRKKFNDYFENHEIELIRTKASLWLSEILVWED